MKIICHAVSWLLLAMLPVLASGCRQIESPQRMPSASPVPSQPPVVVAHVLNTPSGTPQAQELEVLLSTLRASGVQAIVYGSRGLSVAVSPEHAERARQIVHEKIRSGEFIHVND